MLFLVIDTTFLCHRSFYSTGGGSGVGQEGGLDNGVVFGILRDIAFLQETLQSDGMAFCFDQGTSKRKAILPSYKGKRQRDHHTVFTKDYSNRRKDFQRQVNLLRGRVLPELGFRNVFSIDGYEADDLIASCCLNTEDQCVIVGSDKDFYQLLSDRVTMWKPKEKLIYTRHCFTKQWKAEPEQWAMVKALAGCSTDNIRGVPGVKEITAVKYLNKTLSETCLASKNIALHWPTVLRNLPLVKLPFEGTPVLKMKKDRVPQSVWRKVAADLGMKSLVAKGPTFC